VGSPVGEQQQAPAWPLRSTDDTQSSGRAPSTCSHLRRSPPRRLSGPGRAHSRTAPAIAHNMRRDNSCTVHGTKVVMCAPHAGEATEAPCRALSISNRHTRNREHPTVRSITQARHRAHALKSSTAWLQLDVGAPIWKRRSHLGKVNIRWIHRLSCDGCLERHCQLHSQSNIFPPTRHQGFECWHGVERDGVLAGPHARLCERLPVLICAHPAFNKQNLREAGWWWGLLHERNG